MSDAGEHPWVVRTDFSSKFDRDWELLRELIVAPQRDPLSGMDFTAYVRFIEDKSLENLSAWELVKALPDSYPGFVVFMAGKESFASPERLVEVVGFYPRGDDPQQYSRKPREVPPQEVVSFRALPSAVQSIENNLSIANMDFDDFANAVGSDGVFRGFPD